MRSMRPVAPIGPRPLVSDFHSCRALVFKPEEAVREKTRSPGRALGGKTAFERKAFGSFCCSRCRGTRGETRSRPADFASRRTGRRRLLKLSAVAGCAPDAASAPAFHARKLCACLRSLGRLRRRMEKSGAWCWCANGRAIAKWFSSRLRTRLA